MENTKLRASQKYKKRSTFDSIWRQLRKNKGAIVGMILLVVIIIIALVSPYIFNYETDVIANNVKERMQHPSSEHWFGTDDLGRDIFARVCYGARYSLAVGLVAVAVALVVASRSARQRAMSEACLKTSSCACATFSRPSPAS